jgi:hypothetical protein
MLGVPNPLVAAAIGATSLYKTISNPYELGSMLNNSFNRLKVFADMSEKVGDKIGSLSKAINSTAPGIPIAAGTLPKVVSSIGYDKKADRIRELANNPDLLAEHLASNIDDLHESLPQVSFGLQKTMVNSVQFLASKLPVPPPQKLLDQPWEPNNTQKQNFMTYYRAVTDPLSVLKDAKSGTLSPKAIEALTETQPELLQEIRNKVMENINPKKAKNLPYGVKISLSTLIGQPLDAGMTRSVVMNNQLTFMGPQQSSQSAPKRTRSTLGGLEKLSLASRSRTETQDDEEDDET